MSEDFAAKVGILSAEGAQQAYPVLWETARKMFPRLMEDDVARVVSLVVGTCSSCYGDAANCRCWDDD